ncbi:hypothetical protein CSUB8523_0271 [Campylobacter subantarcticus LMG 24377]|uniref:Carrier domain-containing protein n=2 Tax=Campylobacter subantarcticus TaxID=497724 RepID=A0A0A8H926_9BACT|nr:hypothetical protein [Campylobacter subantarcticus]EAJ1261271.1 hypothetical protein [Campylobacter lari]AJC90170.1 hypothetical protein CSUB8521_0277 [Campylobacter subantarcticus LMG 24374]AJC91840.1 hypothetical protein CSUB8523_0271 [Campylobacter subantarcticus LMG 24377]EAL3939288.1 hypothetical protein [Campylobacter lari]MPC00169.1 hypothetical protein [Campylobacter subantarcticus]
MKNKIQERIIQTLQSTADEYEVEELKTANENTKLYNGFGGCLDSLALVSLVADLEELLSEEFDKEVILADEKMMSARNSPFKDVESLTEYIVKKLQEQE